MKKYRKPMLDIIEFDNMDVIMDSGLESDDESQQMELNEVLTNSDGRLSEEQTQESDGTAETGGTNQDSEGSADEPVLPEEASAPQEPELDTDETDTQAEPQPDDELS